MPKFSSNRSSGDVWTSCNANRLIRVRLQPFTPSPRATAWRACWRPRWSRCTVMRFQGYKNQNSLAYLKNSWMLISIGRLNACGPSRCNLPPSLRTGALELKLWLWGKYMSTRAGKRSSGKLVSRSRFTIRRRRKMNDQIDVGRRRGWLKNGNTPGNPDSAARCGARTRRGVPCQGPAMANGRCRMHGGRSTGPRTKEGLARSQQVTMEAWILFGDGTSGPAPESNTAARQPGSLEQL
jgi:hypothetical protein